MPKEINDDDIQNITENIDELEITAVSTQQSTPLVQTGSNPLRVILDGFMGKVVKAMTIFSLLLLVLIIIGLVLKSIPVLKDNPLSTLLFSSQWSPFKGEFGFLPFILSTVYVTLIAAVIAIPLSLFTAIYLSEYANKRFLKYAAPMLDILGGIPSVIYGIWGVLLIVPFVRDDFSAWLGVDSVSGYSILSGGVVLAVMVFPVVVQIVYEVLKTVPHELREATLSLGATKWETIKKVVIKRASPGIIAACILGFSRAFGETIAVLMVVGNVVQIPKGIFDEGYPIPALIANNYGEMMSIPMYDSALMFAALILLVIVLVFNVYARWVLNRIEKSIK
ncbi:MAG TPA: phosphate ABC transporter permease subunit PstC [Chitinophagales bacterium]|nr:phosphate ABC transporter permease subunit PstC [Chitinophagales bacterium]HMZ90082.1 phosphate ABC transporter permease subunit PstC [Chitinophagales bacterium]HNA57179.1 phosphate ABC transporter permease subunit PstC [Chitinophagales bacterium]HNE45589.1 phosphate ABC transporter permease subunit PstC [Chitinophagales bacterium]HNF67926.1 phosphate ABC transporter permease subunit PstC [Chitinophagales bacterium]